MDFILINCYVDSHMGKKEACVSFESIAYFFDNLNSTIIVLKDGSLLKTVDVVSNNLKEYLRNKEINITYIGGKDD